MKLITTAFSVWQILLAACSGQLIDGTFAVTESWSVTLEYDDFGNGFTGTRYFSGRESGTLSIQQGEYRLINRTGFQIQGDDRLFERSIGCFGDSCGIDGYYAFGPGYGARAYGLLFLGCFAVKVPLIDGEVPVFHNFNYFAASGNLSSMQGAGDMIGSGLTATVTSTLSITPKTTPATSPPRVTGQPRNVTVDYGRRATLAGHATGAAPLSFQWWKDGVAIDGATSGKLILDQAITGDSGAYVVVVSNAFGSAASPPATLTVRSPVLPVIKIQPRSRTVKQGRTLRLTTRSTGSLPLHYEWHFNDSPIAGANERLFSFPNLQPENGGSYFVVVSNAAGSITSSVATVTVRSP